jgi:predicted phage-related endonuclease
MPKSVNISASRGAAILGLSNWKTQVQSWLEIMEERQPGFCKKNNYELPEFEYSPAMKWGHAFERAITELAEIKRGTDIYNIEKLCKYNEFITCHIDGEYMKNPVHLQPLHEGKTTSYFYYKDNFGEPGTDLVPIEYQIQCQHQLLCTGAEKSILSVLVFPRRVEEWEEMGWEVKKDDEWRICNYEMKRELMPDVNPIEWAKTLNQMGYFHQYEINAHPELQDIMIKHYTDFWNNNIWSGKEPEPQTYDDIKCLVREPVGTIVADENIEHLMAEYKNIKSEIRWTGPLAKRAAQIKVMALNYMKTSESTLDDDTTNKWILRDRQGKKLASYGKDKNGKFIFR